MESDTEKDDEIFFYCNSLEDLKSLTDKDGGGFYCCRMPRFRNIRRIATNNLKLPDMKIKCQEHYDKVAEYAKSIGDTTLILVMMATQMFLDGIRAWMKG